MSLCIFRTLPILDSPLSRGMTTGWRAKRALTWPYPTPRFPALLDRDVTIQSADRSLRGRRQPPDSAMRPRARNAFDAIGPAEGVSVKGIEFVRFTKRSSERHSRQADAARRAA